MGVVATKVIIKLGCEKYFFAESHTEHHSFSFFYGWGVVSSSHSREAFFGSVSAGLEVSVSLVSQLALRIRRH